MRQTIRTNEAARARLQRVLTALVAATAAGIVALTATRLVDALRETEATVSLVALAVVLQLLAGLYRNGSVGVSAIGVLAAGFTLGIEVAVAAALVCAGVHAVRRRTRLDRAVFTAGTLALAGACGSGVFALAGGLDAEPAVQVLGAVAGAAVYSAVNIALVGAAMSLSEGTPFAELWRARLRWVIPHHVAFGPLALGAALAYEHAGVFGLIAFASLPVVLAVAVRVAVARLRAALEQLPAPAPAAARR